MKTLSKILAVAVLISNFTFGQDISKRIDSIIKDNYKKNPDVGISVGFIQNNKEYYTAYGNLSTESQIEINKSSIFEIASITKILTSNLIAQAAIEHKIKLDDFQRELKETNEEKTTTAIKIKIAEITKRMTDRINSINKIQSDLLKSQKEHTDKMSKIEKEMKDYITKISNE